MFMFGNLMNRSTLRMLVVLVLACVAALVSAQAPPGSPAGGQINVTLIVSGAISGLLSAIGVDYHAWSQTPERPFDWGLALKRWTMGAFVGALAGLGGSAATGGSHA